jgi:hypothetical protein
VTSTADLTIPINEVDGSGPDPSALFAMVQMLSGFKFSQALYVVAKLDIATALLAGPRKVDDLAAEIGCHEPSLRRILRNLAGMGVFTSEDDESFAVTPQGAMLAAGVPGSLRDMALMSMETEYAPFADLLHTVRTGVPAAVHHYGQPYFDWLARDPERVALFTAVMASMVNGPRAGAIQNYQLPGGKTVADIGGADGSLLAMLVAGDPTRRGIVFDQPHVIPAAVKLLEERGLADRVEAVAGDFFTSVPSADVYLLSMVLHDWDDAACARILRSIVTSASPGARLLVIEVILPPVGDEPHPANLLDLTMLGMLTGRERTAAEYETLLASAGFTVDHVVPALSYNLFSIIEATLN